MPSNLTWWEAAQLARSGPKVRREVWLDPLPWITYTTGFYWRHEEQNLKLPAPAAADPVKRIVQNTQFMGAEFDAHDWTTQYPGVPEPPPAVDPADPNEPGGTPDVSPGLPPPPPDGYEPPIPPGGGGGTESGGSGSGSVIVPPNLPPPSPAPPSPPSNPPPSPPPIAGLPHWESMSATLGSGLAITGTLDEVATGTSWSCTFRIPVRGIVVSLGVANPPAETLSSSHDIDNIVAGDVCFFVAVALSGPASLRDAAVHGTCLVT